MYSGATHRAIRLGRRVRRGESPIFICTKTLACLSEKEASRRADHVLITGDPIPLARHLGFVDRPRLPAQGQSSLLSIPGSMPFLGQDTLLLLFSARRSPG